MSTATLYTTVKTWKQPRGSPTDDQIKMWGVCIYIYTHIHIHTMEYYSAVEKDEIMALPATWMDLEIINMIKSL